MNLYGIQNRSTIDSCKKIIVTDGEWERSNYLKGVECVSIAQVIGYVEVGHMVIIPYSGEYGEGYVVCSHNRNPHNGKASTRFMNIEYWVEED